MVEGINGGSSVIHDLWGKAETIARGGDVERENFGCNADGPSSFPGKGDRKSTRLNSSHGYISYAVFFLHKIPHFQAWIPFLQQFDLVQLQVFISFWIRAHATHYGALPPPITEEA